MPSLLPECQGYYRAFGVLSGRRLYNEAGIQPLQVTEVSTYLTEGLGISGGEKKSRFLHLLIGMDSTFMASHFKKQESERKS